MKTSILKWDLRIQLGLALIDLLALAIAIEEPFFLMLAQLLIGGYQLCSSVTHIFLQHKSIGFTQWRIRHFFGSLLYLAFLIVLANTGYIANAGFIVLVIILPQAILFAYVTLFKKELDFIEEREFHILK